MSEELTVSSQQLPNSWTEQLTPELKSNETLAKFKSLDDLAKSYIELTSDYSKRLPIPDEKSSPEDIAKFYDRLGRPGDKKYISERNESHEEALKTFEELFYSNGLTKKQGEVILKQMLVMEENSKRQVEENATKAKDENTNLLATMYQDKFDTKMKIALSSLEKYGSKELYNHLTETQFNPSIIDLLVKVGEANASDKLIENRTTTASDSASAIAEIKRLDSDKEFMAKYRDKNHVGHKSAVEELSKLYELAYKK